MNKNVLALVAKQIEGILFWVLLRMVRKHSLRTGNDYDGWEVIGSHEADKNGQPVGHLIQMANEMHPVLFWSDAFCIKKAETSLMLEQMNSRIAKDILMGTASRYLWREWHAANQLNGDDWCSSPKEKVREYAEVPEWELCAKGSGFLSAPDDFSYSMDEIHEGMEHMVLLHMESIIGSMPLQERMRHINWAEQLSHDIVSWMQFWLESKPKFDQDDFWYTVYMMVTGSSDKRVHLGKVMSIYAGVILRRVKVTPKFLVELRSQIFDAGCMPLWGLYLAIKDKQPEWEPRSGREKFLYHEQHRLNEERNKQLDYIRDLLALAKQDLNGFYSTAAYKQLEADFAVHTPRKYFSEVQGIFWRAIRLIKSGRSLKYLGVDRYVMPKDLVLAKEAEKEALAKELEQMKGLEREPVKDHSPVQIKGRNGETRWIFKA